MLESSNVNSRVNGDVLSKQQYVHKVTSGNKNKTERKFAVFIVYHYCDGLYEEDCVGCFLPLQSRAGVVTDSVRSTNTGT